MSIKTVFCGGGKMAEGIIKSLIGKNVINAGDITVSELIEERCAYLSESYGVTAVTDASEAIKEADMIIVAVNPPQVPNVAASLKNLIDRNKIILSIAAGVKISEYEILLGEDKKIVRVMPNTLSQSGNGYSAVHCNKNIDTEDKNFVHQVISALGKVLYIEEDAFGTFTGFCCTSPLWIYKFMEAMIDAGVYAGFNRSQAREMMIENMLGVAKVLEMSGESPSVKIEEMTSPGGITIEGLKSIYDNGGFSTMIINSVDDACRKANKI